MKISILMPVYGVERYIERSARSVLSQGYGDVEFIFVDDASPDRSVEILRHVLDEYPARDAKIIRNPRNLGIAGARNAALDAASGEYILFVDSDDSLAEGALEHLAAAAAQTGADIVSFDAAGMRAEHHYPSPRDYVRALLHRRSRLALWSKLIRRALFDGLRFVPQMDYGEDFYLLPQLAFRSHSIAKLDEPLYHYNSDNSGSISNTLSPTKAAQVVLAAELLEQFFADKPDYAPMMAGMKIHNKISLLQVGDRATWRYARGLYPGLDYRGVPLLFGERLVLWLARLDAYWAMGLYRWVAAVRKHLIMH
jgi:glycosyltransferase involved in cell wall biosynthesis